MKKLYVGVAALSLLASAPVLNDLYHTIGIYDATVLMENAMKSKSENVPWTLRTRNEAGEMVSFDAEETIDFSVNKILDHKSKMILF